jgi:hypothetical protein
VVSKAVAVGKLTLNHPLVQRAMYQTQVILKVRSIAVLSPDHFCTSDNDRRRAADSAKREKKDSEKARDFLKTVGGSGLIVAAKADATRLGFGSREQLFSETRLQLTSGGRPIFEMWLLLRNADDAKKIGDAAAKKERKRLLANAQGAPLSRQEKHRSEEIAENAEHAARERRKRKIVAARRAHYAKVDEQFLRTASLPYLLLSRSISVSSSTKEIIKFLADRDGEWVDDFEESRQNKQALGHAVEKRLRDKFGEDNYGKLRTNALKASKRKSFES